MNFTVFTIGHSIQSMAEFSALMAQFGVATVVDIRSIPNSRHAPQFNKRRFEAALSEIGLNYRFLGDSLGGRPGGAVISEADRRDFFAQLAKTLQFAEGMDALWEIVEDSPSVIMCAEEEPTMCHRRLLVGKALLERGLLSENLVHIRRQGFAETDDEVAAREQAKQQKRKQRMLQ